MPEQSRSQFAGAVIDAYRQAIDRGVNPRHAYERLVLDMASKARANSRQEAQSLAGKAIRSYAAKSIDMSPVDAKAAAVRDVTRPQEAGLDVRNFSRGVIDSAHKSSNPKVVVLAHAAAASDQGRANIRNAVNVAQTAINQYQEARQRGVDQHAAREMVAKAMADRFDNRGRGTQRYQGRRSHGLGM